jgi:hypothetical protein
LAREPRLLRLQGDKRLLAPTWPVAFARAKQLHQQRGLTYISAERFEIGELALPRIRRDRHDIDTVLAKGVGDAISFFQEVFRRLRDPYRGSCLTFPLFHIAQAPGKLVGQLVQALPIGRILI